MPLIGLAVLGLEVALIVHVFKTGRPTQWIFIILFIPLAGSIAYFILELLPELRHSRAGRKTARDIGKVIDPNKDLRDLTTRVAQADTVANKSALAKECLDKGRYEEARQLFESCLTGMNQTDPDLMLGLAVAQQGLADYKGAIETLDALREANPDVTLPEGHLVYAESREALGEYDEALSEYQALANYYPGEEARCRYALLLQKQGHVAEAREQFQTLVDKVNAASKVYYRSQREWYDVARRNLEG